MNLIDKTAPLSSGQTNRDLAALREYVAQSLEQLDFTLTNLKNTVQQLSKKSTQADQSLQSAGQAITALQQQTQELADRVAALEKV